MQGDTDPLIPRIEQATAEQVRELLEEAFNTLFPYPGAEHYLALEVDWTWDWLYARFRKMLDAEAWTSAAEMLVPEGFVGMAGLGIPEAVLWRSGQFSQVRGKAATPALALAAACLRAKGLQAESHSGTCTA